MGISTIQSYQGAKIFEAIGISQRSYRQIFLPDTVSRVGGITMEDIAKQVDEMHSQAFDPLGLASDLTLDSLGKHKRRSGGEEHLLQSADHSYAAAVHQDRKTMICSNSILQW